LEKRWYVKFYVWDLGKGSLVPKQDYGDLARYHSYADRYRAAQKLKKKIDSILKAGYVINSALDDTQYLEKSKELKTKEKFTIVEAFRHALRIKTPEVEPVTVSAYENVVNRLSDYLESKRLQRAHISTFNNEMVNGYFDWLKGEYISPKTREKLSNTSVNNHRTYFRVLVNVLLDRERILKVDPSADVPKLKEKTAYHEIYLDEDISKLKNHLEDTDPHLWLLCQFVYYCFVRPKKEARLLQIKHLKTNNVLAITEDVSKTDIRFPVLPVPLQQSIADWELRKYPGHYYIFAQGGKPGPDPCYINYWTNKYQKVRETLRMDPNKTLYSWKHTGACKLYLATKDVNKVKEQCGHKSLETTLIYLRQLGMFDNKEVENLFPEI